MSKQLFVISTSRLARELFTKGVAFEDLHTAIFVPGAEYSAIISYEYYERCFRIPTPMPEDWQRVIKELVLAIYHTMMLSQEGRGYWRPRGLTDFTDIHAHHIARIAVALQEHGYAVPPSLLSLIDM